MRVVLGVLFVAALVVGVAGKARAQFDQVCNANGNLILFSNYEGGTLNLSFDVDQGPIYVGIVSYEVVDVNLTGPFVANVQGLIFAGFNSPNITGIDPGLITIYSTTNGNPAMSPFLGDVDDFAGIPFINCITSGSGCTDNTNDTGGGNSSNQIVQFFYTEFGSGISLYSHATQYETWSGSFTSDQGGNCCLEAATTDPNPIYAGNGGYDFIPDTVNLCNGPVSFDLNIYPVLFQPPIYPGYVWSDGQTGPVATFSEPGTYSFYAADYCHSDEELFLRDTVVVLPCCDAPPAPLATGPETFCQGTAPGQWSATASAGGVINWYDDASLTTPIATGNFFTPPAGEVTATYYVTESIDGCESPFTSFTVTQVDNPNVTVSSNGDFELCIGETLVLTASGAETYEWSTGETTASITISSPGTYLVTGTNGGECSQTANPVVISPCCDAPPAPDVAGNTTYCDNSNPSALSVEPSAGGTISWYGDPGLTILLATGNSFIPPATGVPATYYVVETANDCASASTAITISPVSAPVVTLTPEGSASLCPGDELLVTASGADSYVWSTGATGSTLTITEAGIFQVTGELTSGGCSGTSNPLVVSLATRPEMSIDGPGVLCPGEVANLVISTPEGAEVAWNTGDITPGIQVEPSQTTTYLCEVFFEGCTYEESYTVQVSTINAPSIPPTYVVEPFQFLELTIGNAEEYTFFNWVPATDLSCASCPNPQLVPGSDATYTVTVRNAAGCTATRLVRVLVEEPLELFAPNAFTPNGDDKNEVYKVFFSRSPVTFRMTIYDRWGSPVFETTDVNEGWRGGDDYYVMNGTYTYVIEYLDGIRERKATGFITVIR